MKSRAIYTFLFLLTLASLACMGSVAQSAAPPSSTDQPRFEVASIHMVDDQGGAQRMTMPTLPSDLFSAHNWTLKILTSYAYDIEGKYIESNRDWLDSQNYSIDAKVEGGKQLTYEQVKPLLQQLLEDRFHLAAHRVRKMTSGYVLVVAKGGPKLQPSPTADTPTASIYPNGLQFRHANMRDLAAVLGHPIDYPVVDNTGITGAYDIKLSFAPTNDPGSALPSIFTALQEQLGLKLESQKVPVDYLVIDHVDRTPTEN